MLIKTKLHPPTLRFRLLFRKALVKRLCAAVGFPFILITGPAGSGKTSLVCQWIKQENFSVAWYSLDEEDNEPDLFFRNLLTTLARADGQLHQSFKTILDHGGKLEAESVIPHLIDALFNLSRDIRLVLDDFHQIENKKIHDAFVRLIQYIPVRLHVVILSRSSFPVSMNAAIIKKEWMMLSAADLRFTQKETTDFYKKVYPFSLSVKQIQFLNRHAEGWAAGLQFISNSMRSQEMITDVSIILDLAHEQIGKYLIHDILQKQPQGIRDFIFATVLLDRFNPELCSEVTGMPQALKILIKLDKLNLFLIPLDTRRNWYRYHYMFSEAVRRQVADFAPDAIPVVLRKAASWLAHNNYLEDSLHCAFRSNDLEFTADLMEEYIIRYAESFELASGLRWSSKITEKLLNQRPLLKLQQCCLHSILGDFSEVKKILSTIEGNGRPDFGRYSDAKQTLCQDYNAYLKCLLHILYAGETADIDQIQTLRDKIFPQNPLLVGGIETHIVFTLISKGDLAMAESFFARLLQIPLTNTGQLIRKKIYHTKIRALIAKHRGQLQKAETIILQTLQIIDQQGFGKSPMAFLLHRQLGNAYYCQNRLDEARDCADKAAKYLESQSFGLMDEIMTGNELRFQLHRAAGEYEKTVQCIRQMQDLSNKLKMPRITASADVCFTRFAIDRNNLAVAQLWSERRKLTPDEPFSLLFAMECLTQARFSHAKGQYGRAMQLLVKLRNRCVKRTLWELVLKIDILQAATMHAMKQEAESVSLFKKALAFAETEGYIRPFVNYSKQIEPLLKRIAAETPDKQPQGLLEKILTACDIIPPPAMSLYNYEHEQLTQREVQILKWMAKGFQNKEISQKGSIAVTTVKSHVSNILVKLNVKTRTQAILKAKERKILELV